MKSQKKAHGNLSESVQEDNELLKAALVRPGVREVVALHKAWQEDTDSYRGDSFRCGKNKILKGQKKTHGNLSESVQEDDELLKAALARPGVREVVALHKAWQEDTDSYSVESLLDGKNKN